VTQTQDRIVYQDEGRHIVVTEFHIFLAKTYLRFQDTGCAHGRAILLRSKLNAFCAVFVAIIYSLVTCDADIFDRQ